MTRAELQAVALASSVITGSEWVIGRGGDGSIHVRAEDITAIGPLEFARNFCSQFPWQVQTSSFGVTFFTLLTDEWYAKLTAAQGGDVT